MANQFKPRMVIFPFMSKGHTIPLLHLARCLVRHGMLITIFTTPANRPFIDKFLNGINEISIVELLFPNDIPGVPPGAESTDELPSMSLFIPFVNGLKPMQPLFEEALEKIHSQVSCIISDGFLPWTLQAANRFGIPRLSSYGMNTYATVVTRIAFSQGLISMHESPDEPFTVTDFPWIQITRNHFDLPLVKTGCQEGPHWDFMKETGIATQNSYGLLLNSFNELEKTFVDYYNLECQPKAYFIGPLCLESPCNLNSVTDKKPKYWMDWLDKKIAEKCAVLYVAFGSQATISSEQFREIALGLEESKVCFLWVVRKNREELELLDGFEERVKERGILVNEWVDQGEILAHEGVQGFLSHCGWNSAIEGICAGKPILAWPMMAEQCLNAKMVVEEIKVGLHVVSIDGSVKGFVAWESLKNSIIELMEGEKAKELRGRVKEVAKAARNAVAEGGSSCKSLDQMIAEVQKQKEINTSKPNSSIL